jgi:hypothetical protein
MYFNFSIFNIFSRKEKFDILFLYQRHLYGKKYFEFQCDYYNYYLFKFEFTFQPIKKDHGGLRFELNILGYSLDLNIYDSRHWDDENNCWDESEDVVQEL